MLRVKIKVPAKIQIIDPLDLEGLTDSEEEFETMPLSEDEFLAFAAKLVHKSYSGDPLGLQAFVNALKLLKRRAGDTHKAALVEFVMTRLDGKALDEVSDEPEGVDVIIDSLKGGITPDSSDVIASRMLGLRLDRGNIPDFVKQTEELAEAMQRALVVEKVPKEVMYISTSVHEQSVLMHIEDGRGLRGFFLPEKYSTTIRENFADAKDINCYELYLLFKGFGDEEKNLNPLFEIIYKGDAQHS